MPDTGLTYIGWDIPWEPGSQAHTNCWQKFTCFCHKFDRKMFSTKSSKKFLSNKCFLAERRDFLLQKYYQKETFFSVRNVLPRKKISFNSKKFVAARRFFIILRNFLSQEEISCHGKKFHFHLLYSKTVFTRRNLIAKTFFFN